MHRSDAHRPDAHRSDASERGTVNFAGHQLTVLTVVLFALGVFFLAGVYSALRQGLKGLAVLAFLAAALAIAGGVLRL
jgi:cation transport ATPase